MKVFMKVFVVIDESVYQTEKTNLFIRRKTMFL